MFRQHQIRTLIIEDNPQTLQYIEELVINNPGLSLLGKASNIDDANKKLKVLSPNLVLMDIELGDATAFDLLDKFQNNNFDLIFITGHEEYFRKAFEYFAFSFLPKPFDKEKFEEVVQTYLQKTRRMFNHYKFEFLKDFIQARSSKFLLQTGNIHLTIDLEDVAFCKSDGNYTFFYFVDGSNIMANNTLKFYCQLLDQKGFFRISRFHLINIQNIDSIHKRETIVLKKNYRINVSVRNRQKLNRLIEKFNFQ